MEFEPKMPPVALVEPQASVDYRRTREMTIDEILLENRVVFLTGEINYASATRVMMQMLYLEDQKKGPTHQLLHQLLWWRGRRHAGHL